MRGRIVTSSAVLAVVVLSGASGMACRWRVVPRGIEIARPDLQPVLVPSLENLGDLGREQVYRRELLLKGSVADATVTDYELSLAFGELGKLYQAYGFPESAVNCFANAHRLDATAFAWLYYRARCHAALEDHGAALASAETALRMRPQDLPTVVLLGDSYLGLNRLVEARSAYGRALGLDPQCATAWFWLGQIALAMEDYPAAIEALETVLRLQPQASRAYYPLAMACRASGALEAAEEHLARRGKLLPAFQDPLLDDLTNYNVATWKRRGSDAFRVNRPEEAVRVLERTVRMEPDDFVSRMNLGSSYVRLGDGERALEEYREALRIDPGNHLALFNMGSVLLGLDRVDEAVESLTRAVDTYPEDGPSRNALARGLYRLGRHDEALVQVDAAVRHDPSSESARVLRARLLAKLGRCRKAMTGLEEDLKLFPDSVELIQVLLRLLAACSDGTVRDPARALRLARELFENEPTAEHGSTVALAFASSGDFSSAVSWQHDAINLLGEDDAPQHAETMRQLLRLYQERRMPVIDW